MMKKWILIPMVLALAACSTTSKKDIARINAEHEARLNIISQTTDCTELESMSGRKQEALVQLKKAQNLGHAGNALTVGAALLSLNPTILFDARRHNDITQEIENTNKEIAAINERMKTVCGKTHEINKQSEIKYDSNQSR